MNYIIELAVMLFNAEPTEPRARALSTVFAGHSRESIRAALAVLAQ